MNRTLLIFRRLRFTLNRTLVIFRRVRFTLNPTSLLLRRVRFSLNLAGEETTGGFEIDISGYERWILVGRIPKIPAGNA
ncbi:MAG: hypothetical protein GY953_56505 [bacterium]|nr:hypothetical protein [bacterium]